MSVLARDPVVETMEPAPAGKPVPGVDLKRLSADPVIAYLQFSGLALQSMW